MLATITAALMMLCGAATVQAEGMVRRIHDATISLVSLDRQMVGRLMRTVVPDILYLEYKSLYLEVKASGAARVDARPPGAVAGRAAMERCVARRDASPHLPARKDDTFANVFTNEDRKLLRQIHRATVYGETPTDAQLAGDVRREQVAYGLRFYKPSTRYVTGVSYVQAARKAIVAPQFVGAEGAYSLGELKTLAKAIERAYNQGDSAT